LTEGGFNHGTASGVNKGEPLKPSGLAEASREAVRLWESAAIFRGGVFIFNARLQQKRSL
jgi:hypothetical protein